VNSVYGIPSHEHARDNKISPRVLPAVHLGIDPQRRGYVVYIPHLNRIATAYHLIFQECKFLSFTPHGVANIPRKVRPLRDIEPMYRESRDKHNESQCASIPNDDDE